MIKYIIECDGEYFLYLDKGKPKFSKDVRRARRFPTMFMAVTVNMGLLAKGYNSKITEINITPEQNLKELGYA